MRYSVLSLAWNAITGHKSLEPAWRDAAPRKAYDVVIIGGGGHGLATAYYLAKEHGITNVAVLEKSWIGSGNAGRNTTIIRSNYLLSGNIPFYEWSMKLWEGLERDLNYNVMVSQRGVLNLHHSDLQRDAFARRGNAMRLHGVDAELLDRDQVQALVPYLDFDNARKSFRAAAAMTCCRAAAAPRGTTPSCGDTQELRMLAASILSRTAKSPALAFLAAASRVSRRREDRSAPIRWRSPSPAAVPGLPPWQACACRSKVTCCRRSSQKR